MFCSPLLSTNRYTHKTENDEHVRSSVKKLSELLKQISPGLEKNSVLNRSTGGTKNMRNRARQHYLGKVQDTDDSRRLTNTFICNLIKLIKTPQSISMASEVIDELKQIHPISIDIIRSIAMRTEEILEKNLFHISTNILGDKHDYKELINSSNDFLMMNSHKICTNDKAFKLIEFMMKHLSDKKNMEDYLLEYKLLIDKETNMLYQNHGMGSKPVAKKSDMPEKMFTFIGCGLPLTALFFQIETNANVTIIDNKKYLVNQCNKFLDMLAIHNLINRSKYTVLCADASEVCIKAKENLAKPNNGSTGLYITTDYLHLASAIPSYIRKDLIEHRIDAEIPILLRSVLGLGELLYESFPIQENIGHHHLIATLTPPYQRQLIKERQDVLRITPHYESDVRNVTVCYLLVNKQYGFDSYSNDPWSLSLIHQKINQEKTPSASPCTVYSDESSQYSFEDDSVTTYKISA